MYATRLDRPGAARLSEIDPDDHAGLTKEAANARLETLGQELEELQDLLYAAATHSVLVVLQGRDTAGKDGTIKNVFGFLNPPGYSVASFKVPTSVELSHDFLWRVHAQAPAKGHLTIFNRSHYEDVLVVRVHGLAPETVWKRRYDHINHFEELLHDSGVILVKFCLHISLDEQKERLLAREQETEKAWKLSPGDWAERRHWDDYTAAYEEALGRCAAPHAPWYVVPANHKWFRNLAVAEALVETLRPYKAAWLARLEAIGATQKAALAAMRKDGAG